MNWTGGRLQRSRSAGTSLSALQKNHFARARTRLQNGPQTTSPLKIPVFEIANREGGGLPEYESLLPTGARSDRTQRRLKVYHSTAPVAKRLSPIKFRRSHDISRSPQSHYQRHRSRISEHKDIITHPEIKDTGLRHSPVLLAKDESDLDDLYGMKPTQSSEQSLKDKRRELLQRQDWVKSAISKPLKMEFEDDKNRERIGKRRRLREDDFERVNSRIYKTPVLSMNERACFNRRGLPPSDLPHDIFSVRVGTSIHGSQRTYGERNSPPQKSRQSYLSDPMLLDVEEVTPRYHHASSAPTLLDLGKSSSADGSSFCDTNTKIPLGRYKVPPPLSPAKERYDHTIHLPSLPSAFSSPRNIAVNYQHTDGFNGVTAAGAEFTPQANCKPYSDREAGPGDGLRRLIFTPSPRPKRSSTPGDTVETTSKSMTNAQASKSAFSAKSETVDGTNDACWKKFLDISGSSVTDQNIDTSPLSKATAQDLAALHNEAEFEIFQTLAGPKDKNPKLHNLRPRSNTDPPEHKDAQGPELNENWIMIVPNAEHGGGNHRTDSFQDDDSMWREFLFGDEEEDDNNTNEQDGDQNNAPKVENQPSASSVLAQASSDGAVEASGAIFSSEDSPSSNSYLVPALPRMAETSSPDPLNRSVNSPKFVNPRKTLKLLFTKPTPFVGKRARGDASTFRIGQRLQSKERLEEEDDKDSRKKRGVRRPHTIKQRQSGMTWRLPGSDEDEDIVDD